MSPFNYTYTGFYGQMKRDRSGLLPHMCWRLGHCGEPFSGKNGTIQWFHPYHGESVVPLPPTSEGQVLLAGLIWPHVNAPQSIAHTIVASIMSHSYQGLAAISENAAGCFIRRDGSLSLWVGFASNDSLFFRIDDQICWSTNPLDLVSSEDDLDIWALRRCCHGDDAFIYKQEKIRRVEQGHLVTIQPDANGRLIVDDVQFDRFLPDPRLSSGRIEREHVVQLAREALLGAVRPLISEERVGIMLSGGVGSAALLSAMKETGVKVIAYHIESQEPGGSESRFARMVCDALDIPLVTLPMSSGPDYLSQTWVFSHPDGHPWPRWFEQIAKRARQDGVNLMVTGAGDDHAFGPEMNYGVHSIMKARIAWREKMKMVQGLLATDWNIFAILRSAWPWPPRQLLGLTYVAGPSREDRFMRRADFLTPLPPYQREIDAALLHSPCFTAQNMAIEQTILQPNGVRLYYPYHHRELQALSLALPDAYRLMPRESLLHHEARQMVGLARAVDKAILRLACSDTPLPLEVVWRTWSVPTQASIQAFCLAHTQILQEVLGSDSCLAKMNIVDPTRLKVVLASRTSIRDNYTSLIACALVELFLKNALRGQCQRGGPVWK